MSRIRRSRRRDILPGEDLELVEDYGEIVRRARMDMGLSQEDLAQMINEKLTIVKKIESGEFRPSLDLARKLEKTLNIRILVPVEELEETSYSNMGKPSTGISLGDLLRKERER